jgi:hypothetical protein
MGNDSLEYRLRSSLAPLRKLDGPASRLRDNARRAKISMLAVIPFCVPSGDRVLAPGSMHAVDWLRCTMLGHLMRIVVECLRL